MIRIGIAGIGFIAEEYIKLITAGSIQNARITALSSRNTHHMAEIKEKYQLTYAALFTDYESMLDSGRIDMVMICTPHFQHPEMAIKAINKGIHTLIEKPIGVFPEELKALTESITAHPEVKTGVLYCRRTNPVYANIKHMLKKGELGKLKRISWIITDMYRPQFYFDCASWRGTYSAEGGGILMNQVSHHIDLLVWLCGLPEAMQAHCYTAQERNIEVENEVSITMEYAGNAIGQFIASTRECPGSNRLEISGSKGQIILDNESTLTLRKLEVDETEYAMTAKNPFGRIRYKEEIRNCETAVHTVMQANIVNNFIAAVFGNEDVLCPVEDAIQAQMFIQGAYLSSWLEKKLHLPVDAGIYTQELKKRMG